MQIFVLISFILFYLGVAKWEGRAGRLAVKNAGWTDIFNQQRGGAGRSASSQKKKINWLDNNGPMEEWQLWVKENYVFTQNTMQLRYFKKRIQHTMHFPLQCYLSLCLRLVWLRLQLLCVPLLHTATACTSPRGPTCMWGGSWKSLVLLLIFINLDSQLHRFLVTHWKWKLYLPSLLASLCPFNILWE